MIAKSDLPWEEDTSMMHPERGITITDLRFHKPTGQRELEVLKTCPAWRDWMVNWISYDPDAEEYVGYAPDQDEICRDCGPTDFLIKYEEASRAWEKEQGPC